MSNGREWPQLGGRLVFETDTPCPLCAAEGVKTNGGYVPNLRRIPDESRLACLHRHGYISKEELGG